MLFRLMLSLSAICIALLLVLTSDSANGCCTVGPKDYLVVNADQTVVIIWDAANKTEHFIRKAAFDSQSDNFGFLVPSPSRPELAESGNDAFDLLQKVTEPETKVVQIREPIRRDAKAADGKKSEDKDYVKVLEQKLVAGFNAAVLESNSAAALVKWLQDNGYAYSPEVEVWAKPYIKEGWIITALKVAEGSDQKGAKRISASAFRMSFKTDRPLFPYREPDYKSAADFLAQKRRLLRIYFIAEARYKGTINDQPWKTSEVVWAGKVTELNRQRILDLFKLPAKTGPSAWWLTEFEDRWPYKIAPGDLYFSPDKDQTDVRRPPNILYDFVDDLPAKEPVAQTSDKESTSPGVGTYVIIASAAIALFTVVVLGLIWLRSR